MNLQEMLRVFCNLGKKAPLISGLFDCRTQDHWEAIREIVPIFIFSTLPIWLSAFIMLGISKIAGNYFDLLIKNISNGELFIYASSLLSPVFYIALNDPPGVNQFPSKLSHIIAVTIIMLLSAVAFALQRSGHQLEAIFVIRTSWTFFIVSIGLRYLATVYRNRRFTTEPGDYKESEKDFVKKYLGHR